LKWVNAILFFLVVQIVLGGIMSGMKAALVYPTWPDMYGAWIPDVLLSGAEWKAGNFVMYDQNQFMPAFIQFFHRLTAYLLFLLIVLFAVGKKPDRRIQAGSLIMLGTAFVQVLLGILTVIHSKGMVPVGLGVYHQAGALLLLLTVLYTRFSLRK
jgi:cytochrome c oxidase assembly protein subunit 15